MDCRLGQLCCTGKWTFLSSSIHLQRQAAQVARQICYRHLSQSVGFQQRGAGKRSEPTSANEGRCSFGDIIKCDYEANCYLRYNVVHWDECESSSSAEQQERSTTGHSPSDGWVCSGLIRTISSLFLSDSSPRRAAWAFPAITGLHSTGRRSLSLPVHFGLALSD